MCVLLCRYFLLDPDLGQLHYFVNEQGKSQKPRGSLPLIGAAVTQSDEAPHMFIVHSVTGELYKLRGETCSSTAACCGLQCSGSSPERTNWIFKVLECCLRGTFSCIQHLEEAAKSKLLLS